MMTITEPKSARIELHEDDVKPNELHAEQKYHPQEVDGGYMGVEAPSKHSHNQTCEMPS
jgi:hypothetical protein